MADVQWAKMEPHCLGKPTDPARRGGTLSLGTNFATEEGWTLSAGDVGRFGEGARDHGFLFGGRWNF